MSDSDSDDYNDSPEFLPGYDTYGNIGYGGMKLTKFEKQHLDPLEKFIEQTKAIIYNLNEYEECNIEQAHMEKILSKAKNLQYVYNKNATVYVLGYLCVSGNKVNKEMFDNTTQQILPLLNDKNIKPEDVLRYARLWTNL